VASGSDVILLPEIEYEVAEVARVCRDRERSGQRFTIVAVAEGARRKEGDYVVQERGDEYTDSIRLGGISRVLADQLREPLDTSIRTTVLGHMQRGGSPTAYDRNLATALGSRAAALVAVQNDAFTQVPLHEIADKTRTVPADHPLLTSGLDVGTSFGVKNAEMPAHTQPTF
jgi:6-phosphofructokinase 1